MRRSRKARCLRVGPTSLPSAVKKTGTPAGRKSMVRAVTAIKTTPPCLGQRHGRHPGAHNRPGVGQSQDRYETPRLHHAPSWSVAPHQLKSSVRSSLPKTQIMWCSTKRRLEMGSASSAPTQNLAAASLRCAFSRTSGYITCFMTVKPVKKSEVPYSHRLRGLGSKKLFFAANLPDLSTPHPVDPKRAQG
jgi:hypothetical protein